MKYFLLFAFIGIMGCSGCMKNEEGCTPVKPEAEEASIKAFASSNGITAIKHSSGIYYQIINPGMGATPDMNSQVYITYTGTFLNGKQFDQVTDSSKTGWQLKTLIDGWQVGMPLIKKGGKIKLIIPSAYGYRCNGSGDIPPNSILYFDINLLDVK